MTRQMVLLHRIATSVAVICLVLVGTPSAKADFIYTYTGNPFTTAVAPFTTSDFVTVTFTLTQALAASTTTDLLASPDHVAGSLMLSAGPLSLSLSDVTATGSKIAQVTTGFTGLIQSWNIILQTTNEALTASGLQTSKDFFISDAADLAPLSAPADAFVGSNPGAWSVVPEPSTALLLATGFGALAVTRRRRLRQL